MYAETKVIVISVAASLKIEPRQRIVILAIT